MNAAWIEEDLGHARIWTLDRPSARNALSRDARAQLERMVASVDGDPEVRSVIITGAGEKAFCAGADMEERSRMSEEEVRSWLRDLERTFVAIERSPKVFIAAMGAAALGGGLELALSCDIRVASRSAVFGLPEVRLAIIPGGGGTQRLPRLIGPGAARDLILTGRRVDAEEALRIGLVERLASPEAGAMGALELAKALAAELFGCGPLALAKAKEAIRDGLELPLERALSLERECYEAVLASRDRLEGISAFREKRPPRYRGE